ncbi:MAG: CHAP domain-containing protein [Bacteroidia bacterium]|nr:CHAP domain-containing protein [Bacteroidia bacterium]
MKRWAKRLKRWTILFICTTLILLAIDYLRIGKPINEYNGVPIYYNGLIFQSPKKPHRSEKGIYYGIKWESTEFVRRYYYEKLKYYIPAKYHYAITWVGHNIKAGERNPIGLRQYYNGGTVKPQKDDIIVFKNKRYGHAAIIGEVYEDMVVLYQQNVWGWSKEKCKLKKENHRYYIESYLTPIAWMRK